MAAPETRLRGRKDIYASHLRDGKGVPDLSEIIRPKICPDHFSTIRSQFIPVFVFRFLSNRYYRGLYARVGGKFSPLPLSRYTREEQWQGALYAKHEYRLMNAIVPFSASIC